MTAPLVRKRRRIRWLIGVVLVAALVVAAVLAVVGSANRRQADDPRSPIATGAGALGQLLRDQGIQITTTTGVEDAIAAVDPTTTLVVANPDQLRTLPKAVQFAKAFLDAGKPVAVICHGPWTLVESGAVKGRTLTSWPSLQTDIRNAGGTWVDEELVVDEQGPGPLLSSRKPDDLKAFCAAIVDRF